MTLPCLAGECDADNARARLASGETFGPVERADLELAALGCQGPQRDPWDASLTWDGCPAKVAMRRPDIDAALTVRGLSSMAPLSDWPHGYASHVVETWAAIESEKAAFRKAGES